MKISKTSKTEQKKPRSKWNVKVTLTIIMGVFIPLFSLALSHVGGTLARQGHGALSLFAFLLMGAVLSVSLAHLAWAVSDITSSPKWASWALAVAFDLALVLGELIHVTAHEAGLGNVVTAMMAAVCGLSMFLNCWAFIRHPAPARK